MNELDMSRPGSELFPEVQVAQPYNSYNDVIVEQVVDAPNSGVTHDVAGQDMSDKQMNFQALREEAAKLQSEREYWKGQAEAFAKSAQVARTPEPTEDHSIAMSALDFEDSRDVKKAWESLQQENQKLRREIQDTLAAVETKSQYQDWNNMVTSHVPELTKKNPMFAEMINNASNPYEAAYLLAELNAKASQPVAQQPPPFNGNAQRAIANSQKPQTIASVGGQGQLSAADYYASMSDEDFHKIAAKNLANI